MRGAIEGGTWTLVRHNCHAHSDSHLVPDDIFSHQDITFNIGSERIYE